MSRSPRRLAGSTGWPTTRVKRGVFGAVEGSVSHDLTAHSLGPIGAVLTALLDVGKANGTIRPDIDARDVILLIGYLTRLE